LYLVFTKQRVKGPSVVSDVSTGKKFSLEQAMKAQRRSRGIALLFL
jgi:hypothetical protein